MTITRLITVLEVPLRGTRVRDIIAFEALLMRARHNQIARGSRLFTYLTFVKMFYFVVNWNLRRVVERAFMTGATRNGVFVRLCCDCRLPTCDKDILVSCFVLVLPNCWTEAATGSNDRLNGRDVYGSETVNNIYCWDCFIHSCRVHWGIQIQVWLC